MSLLRCRSRQCGVVQSADDGESALELEMAGSGRGEGESKQVWHAAHQSLMKIFRQLESSSNRRDSSCALRLERAAFLTAAALR